MVNRRDDPKTGKNVDKRRLIDYKYLNSVTNIILNPSLARQAYPTKTPILRMLNRPMTELKELTTAEWKIMRIVWEERKAMTREVYTIAAERYGWRPATVKTLLRRILDKGYLQATQIGNGFLYRPVHSSLSIVTKAVESLLDNAVDGTGPLLLQLVENTPLSDRDLDSLQAMIEQKRGTGSKKPDQKSGNL